MTYITLVAVTKSVRYLITRFRVHRSVYSGPKVYIRQQRCPQTLPPLEVSPNSQTLAYLRSLSDLSALEEADSAVGRTRLDRV